MRVAYSAAEVADSRNLLYQLHDELLQSNPSAAASLMEGMEECLTVSNLRLPARWRAPALGGLSSAVRRVSLESDSRVSAHADAA